MLRAAFFWLMTVLPAFAASLTHDQVADMVVAPYAVGEEINDKGVWQLLNSGGGEAGYVFETGELAPLPGFSGKPINMLVMLDLEGRFIAVKLIAQHEPVFVSGLGEAPFRDFLEQYRGHSINEPLVVGTPYGGAGSGSDLVYLDGVTKATASVRIAHESILAATLAVAREKMQGISAGPPPKPDPDHVEDLDWKALADAGLIGRLRVTNAEEDAAFKNTKWAYDDTEGSNDPNGMYLDLYVIDLGPPSIAKAVLSPETYAETRRFLSRAPDDELYLLIEVGRQGLVSEDFVRNTAPDRISAQQDGLPLALRDADILAHLAKDVPEALKDATKLVVRLDRRLGFDPTRDWQLSAQAVRMHGMFQPEPGEAHFSLTLKTPERFFTFPQTPEALPPWREALRNRATDLRILSGFLTLLFGALLMQSKLAALKLFTPVRLGILAITIGFVGYWGQGQLSIVTPLAVLRALTGNGSLEVLLYDPFSLLIWGAAILGFVLWGRGFFCGWLCPYGAMQEFAHHLGRVLHLPRWEPPRSLAQALLWTGPLALVALVGIALLSPDHTEKAVEIEPFKTAITTHFDRPWAYVLWAAGWIAVSTVWFKGFCRSVCPLGAAMRLGGLLRLRNWIPRRAECGSPCQLCKVRCNYGAIAKSGEIRYSECFQCLDCVKIHDDTALCVPLVLEAKRAQRATGIREAAE